MDNIFVSYIYAKDSDGFITEHKFKKELDPIQLPALGQKIQTWYHEDVELYNIFYEQFNHEHLIIKNNQLLRLFPDDIDRLIQEKIISFIAPLNSLSHQADIKHHLTEIKQALSEKMHIQEDIYPKIEFNLDEYKNNYNELKLYGDMSDNPHLRSMVRHLISGVTHLLVYTHSIDVSPESYAIDWEKDDNGEPLENPAVYYGTVTRQLNHFLNTNPILGKSKRHSL